jgi:putative restriction endonuclease
MTGKSRMNFENWLMQLGKSKRTANSYAQAIKNAISNWAREAKLIDDSLESLQSATQLAELIDAIQKLEIFQERNSNGNGMYSAALRQYYQYLSDVGSNELEEDLEQILDDDSVTTTEKSAQISVRIGQGKFREDLISHWGGCAISGYPNCKFLVASHIKPWSKSSNSERLDPYNGILLLPNLDKVFDLGYITFEESGAIRISEAIEQPSILGLRKNLNLKLETAHQEYMAFHRKQKYEPLQKLLAIDEQL